MVLMAKAMCASFAYVVLASSWICLAEGQATPGSAAVDLPDDAAIRQLLAERVEALAGTEGGLGIVVGVLGPRGRRLVSHGQPGQGGLRPLDGDTVFEIGSVTKVFTALLLADMVRTGEVALADPVAKYLPAGVKVPERNGRSITLFDLATHTSGLPFMPDDLPAFEASATATYSATELFRFLARVELTREIGSEWDYSNLGYWLLGEALGARAGMDFEGLLRARILDPLALKNTAITVSPELRARLAVGHNAALEPAPPFAAVPGYALMPAAGGLVSTTHDLLTLLGVAMGYESSPLAASLSAMLSARRPAGGSAQALGWRVIGDADEPLILHDGGSFGFSSSVAWDPRARLGVVVLSNQVTGVGDIARHLLRPSFPLERPTTTQRTEITLEPALLATYEGRYEVADEGLFLVVLEGSFLTIQPPVSWGLPKLRLRAENLRDFFTAELPLRVSFQAEEDGRVASLLVHPPRGQPALTGHRISPDRSADDP